MKIGLERSLRVSFRTQPELTPDTRVARLVADRLNTNPDSSLRDIAAWLSRVLREPTARGGLTWSAEGVRRVIAQAKTLGVMVPSHNLNLNAV